MPEVPSNGQTDTGEDPGLLRTVAAIDTAIASLFNLASSRRVHVELQRRSGISLSSTEWELLRRVDDLGPVSVSHLASLISRSAPVASRALAAMERNGLVERRAHATDLRMTMFVTTDEGQRLRTEFHAAMLSEIHEVLVGWTREEGLALAGLLTRFASAVRRTSPETHRSVDRDG